MSQKKISEIEKRITELKFLERDLFKERDICRLKSLYKAERSSAVNDIIKKVFLSAIKAERGDLKINSSPSEFIGRDNEEFMSEVKVEIKFKPAEADEGFNELSLYIYLNDGFQDQDVQKLEEKIMERLLQIRKEVNELKESKKLLKMNS